MKKIFALMCVTTLGIAGLAFAQEDSRDDDNNKSHVSKLEARTDDAAHGQERQPQEQELSSDHLVVGGEDVPAQEAGRLGWDLRLTVTGAVTGAATVGDPS